ncbi:hypothetical protein MHU86_21487 [Fragilaria crotonensis]|nr:hypothetical protein MHU86_21487 [Fragilaria crotonensis]
MKTSTKKSRSEQLQHRHSVARMKKYVLPRLKHVAAEAKKAAAVAAAEKQRLAEAAAKERRREQEGRQQSSAPDRRSMKAIRKMQPNGCVGSEMLTRGRTRQGC